MEQNTFVRGLITEASPLTFPENASLDEENFVLNRDGSRQRRLGMDFEDGNAQRLTTYTEGSNKDIEHFLWKNAGNIQNIDISVLKLGNRFFFYDNNAEVVSSSPLNGGNGIIINGLDITGSGNPIIYSYAFINGKMFVASGLQSITILDYDAENDAIISGTSGAGNTKKISIRDTFGIFEDRDITERPIFPQTNVGANAFFDDLDASGIHIYNLINKGWEDRIRIAFGRTSKTVVDEADPLLYTLVSALGNPPTAGHLPSLSDRIQDNVLEGETASSNLNGSFYSFHLDRNIFGTREAPQGAIILPNMFDRGSERSSIVSNRSGILLDPLETTSVIANSSLEAPMNYEGTEGGISTVTAYSGRLVYAVFDNGYTEQAGVSSRDDESPSFGDMIFYSQATEGTERLTRCYTELNPTNTEDFALLDTDGGYITLSGIGTINALEVLGSSLFVFADNGIWQVNGGGSLFTPSNININRITNVGNINKKGVIVTDNILFYLADNGIYQISLSEVDPSLPASVVNITQTTIQNLYNNFTPETKQKSVSSFDRFSNQVKWLFSVGNLPDSSYYDTELILDLTLSSFSVNKIKILSPLTGNSPYVIGYLERPTVILTDVTQQVINTGDNVIVGIDNNVGITFRSIDSSVFTSNKYWTATKSTPTQIDVSVAEYKDLKFRDWGSVVNDSLGFGEDANGFLLTGYLTGGDSSTNKRVTYITTHFRRTERIFTAVPDGFEPDNPSSCTLIGQWEWTRSANAGRWTNPQEIYRLPRTFIPDVGIFDFGHEVVTTKNKLRGKGKALSLLFETSPLKDCHLYGWSYEINTETSV